MALVAAWLAFLAGLLLAGNEITDLASLLIGAVVGAGLVYLGFLAASRCRPIQQRSNAERARVALLALVCGAGLGVANLGANWAMMAVHPTLRTLLTERFTEVAPWVGLVSAPIVEEIALRLFFLSVLTWIVSRFTKRPGVAFGTALWVSSLAFALLHLDRPFPTDPTLANLYGVMLVTKYTLAGLPLGWIFWRWGLPYAILCHSMVNATHLLLQPHLF